MVAFFISFFDCISGFVILENIFSI
jgi:hypothetical protein